jgi:sugar/nucleoside kinase (ribokinase family)
MPALDVVGLGEVVIDLIASVPRFPEPDEKIFATIYEKHPGGVTANFCVGLSRLGTRAGFIGGVGKDADGTYLRDTLRREKVDASRLVTRKDALTPLNFVTITPDGQKAIFQSPYMLTVFPRPEELDLDYVANARVLHTTALRVDTAERAMKHAKKEGLTTSFDLEKHVAVYGFEKLSPLIKMTDILLPNKMGALTLTGTQNVKEAANKLLALGPRIVVITLAEKGCLIRTEKETLEVPAFKVKPVDATGAGDAFNAGLITGILNQWDLHEAAIFANAAAAMKITHVGAQAGLPTRKEVDRFLEKRGHPLRLLERPARLLGANPRSEPEIPLR